jgi:hypothetical protein
MKKSYKQLSAKTIDELFEKLIVLIKEGYGDCEWNGWDTGSICIHPEDKDWIEINND